MTYTCLNPRRVIDSGTNWVKYSDGTGECWGRVAQTLSTAAARCNFVVQLPMKFDTTNMGVSVSGGVSGIVAAHPGYTSVREVSGRQEIDTYIISTTNSTSYWMFYHAIGKLA